MRYFVPVVLLLLAEAVCPPALAKADHQLVVFDCGGTMTLFQLAPLAQVERRQLFDALPKETLPSRDGCNVRAPTVDASGVSIDLVVEPGRDSNGEFVPPRYSRWHLPWANGVGHESPALLPADNQPSPSAILKHSSGTPQLPDAASGLLKDKKIQVVCLSDNGTVVLSDPDSKRMWVITGGQTQQMAFRISRQDICRFM